jgi:hypothetical protein
MAVHLCKPFLKRYHPDSRVKTLKKPRHSAKYCFQALPIELCQEIFEYFTLQELFRARLVSRQFLEQARLKIEHHASRALFSADRIKDTPLKELTGYIEAVRYLVIYLSQDPRKLRAGLLKEVLCWKDPSRTVVNIMATLQQFQVPMPERDYRLILKMANERFTVVDRDHLFIHGARSLSRESGLTLALGVFFQFVETVKMDTCLSEKACECLQASQYVVASLPSDKSYRSGMLQRLTDYTGRVKA